MILTYNNKLANLSGHLRDYGDPYNPCFLDPGVIRFAFPEGNNYDPNDDLTDTDNHFEYVGRINGYYVWDYHPSYYGYQDRLSSISKDFEVWGWNTKGITGIAAGAVFRSSNITKVNTPLDLSEINASEIFMHCSKLSEFNGIIRMSSNMNSTFRNCTSLVRVPVFDWSYIPTTVDFTFQSCRVLSSGLYDFYQHCISATSHKETFGGDCAQGSVSGKAELALIPDNWKYY